MPYTYTAINANDVPTEVATYAGANLYNNNGETSAVEKVTTGDTLHGPFYNLAGQRVGSGGRGLIIVDGKKILK